MFKLVIAVLEASRNPTARRGRASHQTSSAVSAHLINDMSWLLTTSMGPSCGRYGERATMR